MFEDIIEYEMEKLKEMVGNNKLLQNKCNNFIADYDYEDEFSHNDIRKMQKDFVEQAKEYLKDKCKGEFIIYYDWSVHICTKDFFDKNLKGYLHIYEEC